MNNNAISLTRVDTDAVIELIKLAKKRIIFAKPAFLKNEIATLINGKKLKDISVEIYMESGESAIRYGFGETSALKLIHDYYELLEIHTINRLRIGILIVDEVTLVYMPDLTYLEDVTNDLTFPNGFFCNLNVTKDIIKQLKNLSTDNVILGDKDNIALFPGVQIPEIDKDKQINDIKKSIENLEKNPAVNPAKLIQVNLYRNKYKILKMEVCGIRIHNKRLNLKPFYMLLPEGNKRIKSSWSIFTSEDLDELQYTNMFERELYEIIGSFEGYIFDVGRFGYIFDVRKKDEFIKAINKLKLDFISYLRNEYNEEAKHRFQSKEQKSDIKTILENSRKELEKYLLRICPDFEILKDRIFYEYRNLKREYELEQKDAKEILEEFIRLFVLNKLRFPDVDDIIDTIDIKLDWYDISDELLFDNEDFIERIKGLDLQFRDNSVGYESNE